MPEYYDADGNPLAGAQPAPKQSTLGGLGQGFLKGVQIDSTGMLDYLDRALGTLGIPPLSGYPLDTSTPVSSQIKTDVKKAGLEPKGTAESIGSAVGQTLPTMAMPGGGASALGRFGANAAMAAGTGLAGGETPKEAAITGVVGGALPFGFDALKSTGAAALKGLGKAGKGIANLTLGVTPRDVAFGHDPITRVLDEGIGKGAKNISEVAKAVSDGMNSSGKEIDSLVANAPSKWTVKLNDVLTPLDELKQTATNLGRKDIATAADRMKKALSQYTDASGVSKKRFQGLLPEMTQDLKKLVGSGTKWTPTSPSSTDLATNGALQEIYGRLRDALVTAIPELEKPLSRYGDLAAASSGIERTMAKEKTPLFAGSILDLPSNAVKAAVGPNNPNIGLPLARGLHAAGKAGPAVANLPDADFIGRILAQMAVPKSPAPEYYDADGNPMAQ